MKKELSSANLEDSVLFIHLLMPIKNEHLVFADVYEKYGSPFIVPYGGIQPPDAIMKKYRNWVDFDSIGYTLNLLYGLGTVEETFANPVWAYLISNCKCHVSFLLEREFNNFFKNMEDIVKLGCYDISGNMVSSEDRSFEFNDSIWTKLDEDMLLHIYDSKPYENKPSLQPVAATRSSSKPRRAKK